MQNTPEDIKLISGDKALIANSLGVSVVTVGDILKNRRGKRNTLIQIKIKQAAEFCIQKNKEKLEFCMKLAVENKPICSFDNPSSSF